LLDKTYKINLPMIYKPKSCYWVAEGAAGPQTPYHAVDADISDVLWPSESLHTG